MIKIIADTREKNSMVLSELSESGVDVEIKHLNVADYLVGDIAIERKTTSDFINSMLNRRLFKQLEEIRQYKRRILVIEGVDEEEFYNDDMKKGVHANAVRGMLLSSILSFEVPILFTKDAADTAAFFKVLAKRLEKPEKEISWKAKKKAYSLAEQQQLILEGFPGIGPSMAKALLRKFKSIKSIINADAAELEKVKNMGRKKAKIIREILVKRYTE